MEPKGYELLKNRDKNYCSWKRTFCAFWRF